MKHSPDISADRRSPSRLRAILGHRAVWPIVALALIFLVDGFISPGFFQIRIVEGRLFGNLIDIFYRAVPTALVALGMAVVIGTKGIDLSVGSIIAIVGAVITWRIHAGDPHWLVLLIALGAGLLCGLWNGFLVAFLDIQPIIATLILMTSGRGIGLMINLLYGGTNPSFTSPLLQGLSVGHIGLDSDPDCPVRGDFPRPLVIIRRTAFGLMLESVGGNSAAARLVGINARLIIYAAYLISGFCAGLGGRHARRRHAHLGPRQRRPLHRTRRHSRRGHRRRIAVGGPHLSRHDDARRLVIQALTTSILTSGLPPEYNLVVKAVVVSIVLLLQSDKLRGALSRAFEDEAMNEKYLPLPGDDRRLFGLFVVGGLLYNNFLSIQVFGDILADNAFIIIGRDRHDLRHTIGRNRLVDRLDDRVRRRLDRQSRRRRLASARLRGDDAGVRARLRRAAGADHRLLRDSAVHRDARRAFPVARRAVS